MWNSRLAESVGDGAAHAVPPQGWRRKTAVSVGINDVGTTPTRARLNVLADLSPQCRNRYTEMQRICCTPLCVTTIDLDLKVPLTDNNCSFVLLDTSPLHKPTWEGYHSLKFHGFSCLVAHVQNYNFLQEQ
jgi:hypothetical protein